MERLGIRLSGIIFLEVDNPSTGNFSSIVNYYKSLSMSNELETYETNTLVFMVKIWVEESANGKAKAKWRGYITHIPSSAKQYVGDLNEIFQFILPYLEQLGIRPGFNWQIVNWMRRLKVRSSPRETK